MVHVDDGRLVRGVKDTDKWKFRGEIWILVYTHTQNGHVYAYETETGAREGALEIVRTLRASHDVDPNLPEDEVLANWGTFTKGKQSIQIGVSEIRALKK